MTFAIPPRRRAQILPASPETAQLPAAESGVGPILSAIVSAAGLGSRLGALTSERPKALVPVDGEPLLPRLAKQLSDAGAKDLTVVIGYRGDQIRRTLGSEVNGMQVTYVCATDYARTNNIASLAAVPSPAVPVAISDCDVFLSRLPAQWLQKAGSDIVIPTRALDQDEAGSVLRAQDGKWQLKVLRDPSQAKPGDRKTISLYLLFSSRLVERFFSEIGRAVADGKTSLYYEDVLAHLLRDAHSITNVMIEEHGITAFEIDRPADLQAAQRWSKEHAGSRTKREGN